MSYEPMFYTYTTVRKKVLFNLQTTCTVGSKRLSNDIGYYRVTPSLFICIHDDLYQTLVGYNITINVSIIFYSINTTSRYYLKKK